jgi:hypothetical protein
VAEEHRVEREGTFSGGMIEVGCKVRPQLMRPPSTIAATNAQDGNEWVYQSRHTLEEEDSAKDSKRP